MAMMDAQIEKEKADGTFYSNPATQKALGKFEKQADELSENLEKNESKNSSPPFWQKPTGIVLMVSISSIVFGILGFLLGYYLVKKA
jgi:hypothetical protein